MPGSVMMVAGLELTNTTLIAFFLQGLAGLRTGIIKFAGLAYDNGPGAYDHEFS